MSFSCMLFEGVLNLQVCARVSGCGVGVSVDVVSVSVIVCAV